MGTVIKMLSKNIYWESLFWGYILALAIAVFQLLIGGVPSGFLVVIGIYLAGASLIFTVFGIAWSLANRNALGMLTALVYVISSILFFALFGLYLYWCERNGKKPIGS
ncbi:hypothetical protein [Microbulbifer magnicolonia]|uniref:hypothetical protein n=1 Tax=Microbulbifer magnicolonia TaxID=3109744 RepID=UPI002B40D2D5|nr:hypothetical protein [Microbulbifer sp. GG15]